MSRAFDDPGIHDLLPRRVIPKTQKMFFDAVLLNTEHYKVQVKCKVNKSRKQSSALPNTSVLLLLKCDPSCQPRLRSPTYMYVCIYIYI